MKKTTALLTAVILLATACNVEETPPPESPVTTHDVTEATVNVTTPLATATEPPPPPPAPLPTALHVSMDTFELGTGENGELHNEIGGCSFEDYEVWGGGENDYLFSDVDVNDYPYVAEVIFFILGERIYAGTGYGIPFWAELYEEGGQEKLLEVMMLGWNHFLETLEYIFRSAPESVKIQLPPLYRMIHYYEISEEVFMAYHTEACDWWSPRSPEFLRQMFLPEDELREVMLNERGAIFNDTVHNILTLNELFENDREEFAEIDLQELIQYQANLESIGIHRGFNADMVEFANRYNRNSQGGNSQGGNSQGGNSQGGNSQGGRGNSNQQ